MFPVPTIFNRTDYKKYILTLGLLREVAHQMLLPEVVCHNAALSSLEKGVQWEEALAMPEERFRNFLTLDLTSYNAAISASEKGKR